MAETLLASGDQLLHEPPTNRLMLEKLDEARRSRSTNIEERKTGDKFRETVNKEAKAVNIPVQAE